MVVVVATEEDPRSSSLLQSKELGLDPYCSNALLWTSYAERAHVLLEVSHSLPNREDLFVEVVVPHSIQETFFFFETMGFKLYELNMNSRW